MKTTPVLDNVYLTHYTNHRNTHFKHIRTINVTPEDLVGYVWTKDLSDTVEQWIKDDRIV